MTKKTNMDTIYELLKAGATREQMIERSGLTAKQVSQTLSNLKWAGRARIVKKGGGRGKSQGMAPCVYEVADNPGKKFRKQEVKPGQIRLPSRYAALESAFGIRA